MYFPTLAIFTLLGTSLASKPILRRQAADQQVSTIETRIADVAGVEAAIATASGEVTAFSNAVAAFDGTTSENSLAFLTSFSRLGISVNSVSQTVLISGLLNVADSAAVYPDVALFTTSLSRAVGGVQAKSAAINTSGFGGVVCASLESLLVEVELLLETVEAVFDISYENLIGVLADQVDTQFEVALGAFCLA
ncbi:hypothetical protein KVR01_011918 [Diaporthe batatas]|uniref:uncharacterized protein n=1 Tax=Diaporthe batatas TaxID=748121 RepID=UPI001D039F44|nr:uncharacterized protein KVR01_011918 [Diaporthe batatas]KAG8158157.1 hypothetical protein KVR01_011918 [Diaporthe batatas]